jgi:sulfoxide reductase heme-binding subunit YedZ
VPDPLNYGWWLASRSAGVVSFAAVSGSVILGLMMANGLPRRPGVKKTLLGLHESLALVGLVAIAVHGVTLLGDSYLKPSISNIAVPFTLGYRPGFTGLGVIAGYLAAILGLSYYARRSIGVPLWRKLHRATIAVWALGVIHILGAGTDAGQLWMRAVLAATALPIAFLFILRLMPPPAPRPASPGRGPAVQGPAS